MSEAHSSDSIMLRQLRASALSLRSSLSNEKAKSAIKSITSNKKKLLDYARLFSAVAIPLLTVCVLSTLMILSDEASLAESKLKQKYTLNGQSIAALVTSIQKERGMSCVYSGSRGGDQIASVLETLLGIRNASERAIMAIEIWPTSAEDGDDFRSKETFLLSLQRFRSNVTSATASCQDILRWYTDRSDTFINSMSREYQSTDEGTFWSAVGAYSDILVAKDLFGLMRAIGGTYFATGQLQWDLFIKFVEYSGAAQDVLKRLLSRSKGAQLVYTNLTVSNGVLMKQLGNLRALISNNTRIDPDAYMGLSWFSNMTEYINMLAAVERTVVQDMLTYIRADISALQKDSVDTVVVVVVIFIICPPIVIWYTINNIQLMKKLQKFITEIAKKTEEVKHEKRKTDLLLNQMLPPSVVAELKFNRKVPSETFESSTVYFSDVKGFTSLSSKSTPFQVVHLLNELYTIFDSILDRYDVYKVETIGDAYMIVSGVPKRNGNNHSAEICTVALNIMQAMDDFYIPHMPNQKLLIRIGIHTGPVAAGVVGNKMPRYCLFGDTVNTASRMESTGEASKIQISWSTKASLDLQQVDKFICVERGSIAVKGKGELLTYWLVGKQKFPFEIDLAKASKVADLYQYWKPEEIKSELPNTFPAELI